MILSENLKKKRGIVLPFVIIASIIILTSVGIWYQKVLVQSFLSERLMVQRADFKECESLLPVLINKVKTLTIDDLAVSDEEFLSVEIDSETRWAISRSALNKNKIRFSFSKTGSSFDPIQLSVAYSD